MFFNNILNIFNIREKINESGIYFTYNISYNLIKNIIICFAADSVYGL